MLVLFGFNSFAIFVSLNTMIAHFLVSIASQTPALADRLSLRADSKQKKNNQWIRKTEVIEFIWFLNSFVFQCIYRHLKLTHLRRVFIWIFFPGFAVFFSSWFFEWNYVTVTSTRLFIVLSVLLFSFFFFFLKFQLSTVGYFSTSCLNYLSRSNFRSFPFVVLLSRAQPGLYILVSDLFMSLDGSNKKREKNCCVCRFVRRNLGADTKVAAFGQHVGRRSVRRGNAAHFRHFRSIGKWILKFSATFISRFASPGIIYWLNDQWR